jgi:hypothetical protein
MFVLYLFVPHFSINSQYSKTPLLHASPAHAFFFVSNIAILDSPPLKPVAGEERSKRMRTPCEYIEDYIPRGYLPVHFGDIFKDDRCKVIRKLGGGHSQRCGLLMIASKVNRTDGYIDLKILVASETKYQSSCRFFTI